MNPNFNFVVPSHNFNPVPVVDTNPFTGGSSTNLSSILGTNSIFGRSGILNNSIKNVNVGSVASSLSTGNFFNAGLGLIKGLVKFNSATDTNAEKAKVASEINYIQNLLQSINNSNAEAVLNEIERYSSYFYLRFTHQLNRRKWSPEATKAWSYHRDAMKEVHDTVINDLLNRYRLNGFTVNQSSITVSEQSLEDLYDTTVKPDNTSAEQNGNITYNVYRLAGTLKSTFFGDVANLDTANSSISGYQNSKLSGVGMFSVIGGFLVLYFLGIFKFKSNNVRYKYR